MELLVTSNWLNERRTDSDVIVLELGEMNTISGNVPELEHRKIEGARCLDLKNDFSNNDDSLPNTIPSPEKFEGACRKLGINSSSKIVVYDRRGVYWSPRVWWLFKAMGHDAIAILDGGLPDWLSKGYPTVTSNQNERYGSGNFEAHFRSEMLVNFEAVLANTKHSKSVLIDARSSDRFNGLAPEPRKGLRSGHIPNAINIPYTHVLAKGKFKSKSLLVSIFKDLKKEERPLIFSCGSGVTACIVLVASELVLKNKKAIYDGSWTEWAQKID